MGIEIDTGVFYNKDTMEDIVKVRPNSAEGLATLKTGERGCSILSCFPRAPVEIEALRIREQAARVSQANHTFEEALKLAQSDGRAPPENYMETRLTIATYAAKLWSLWTKRCHHYEMVMKVYNTLCLPEVSTIKGAFTPIHCREMIWAIYDDGRRYFSKRKTPSEMAMPDVAWANRRHGRAGDGQPEWSWPQHQHCIRFPRRSRRRTPPSGSKTGGPSG
jgi:hypothetical protein